MTPGNNHQRPKMRVAVPSISFCQTQMLRDELLAAYPDTRFNDTFKRLSQEELLKFLADRDSWVWSH